MAVTLSEAKGLAVRFFAACRITLLKGRVVKCTNVMCFDLTNTREKDRLTAQDSETRIALSELRACYGFLVDQDKGREAVDLFAEDGEFHALGSCRG